MISGIYFDGKSAHLRRVVLEAGGDEVVVLGMGEPRVYPAEDARLAEPFEGAPGMLYFSDGSHCEVDGSAREELARALRYDKPRVVRWQAHWRAALLALVLLIGLIGATVIWGVPSAAEAIAARLPNSVDVSLGQSALESLEQDFLQQSQLPVEQVGQVLKIFRTVLPQHPRIPVRLLVRASDKLGPNALALPDGTIVITDAMLREILGRSEDFDDEQTAQLAGVLAHEIGHIERRHGTRTMARTSLTAALSATLFGDFSAVAAGTPAVLMSMSYSREMETEADDYAIAVLRQKNMPLRPLANLFAMLERMSDARSDGYLPRWLTESLEYASSHPATADRIARLRKADRQP
jgi:Zn-dependent protease with chaperone function